MLRQVIFFEDAKLYHIRQYDSLDIAHHQLGWHTATAPADDNVWLVLIVFRLGDHESGIEIVVGEGRVENGVAVLGEIGRFDAAGDAVPAVEEEDSHRFVGANPAFLPISQPAEASLFCLMESTI
ncbi:MAG: hypothetical protein WEB58_16885 [Planctomycetaceae bacterium]